MIDRRRRLLLGGALALACGARAAEAKRPPPTYTDRSDVKAFVDAFVAEHGIPLAWVQRVLSSGRRSAQAERLMTPSLTPPPRDWTRYRARALDEVRLRDAATFLLVNREALARAEEEFGVPPEIVAAIIGIETGFGRIMGRFRTLDVLMTLAFDYPRRAVFYQGELASFLLLGHGGQIDAMKQTGSFAGAIGLPQFMPSSIRRYAIDFDGDGRIDLARSAADAIGSVAHYLHRQGWQRDHPVMFDAVANEAIADELGRGIDAARSWAEVADLGVRIDGYLAPQARVVLLDLPYRLDEDEGVAYRIGTVNMAAILHYNRSYFYGAAVAEFAASLKAGRGGEDPSAPIGVVNRLSGVRLG